MRSIRVLLALGAAASAFVVPNQETFANLQPETEAPEHPGWKHHGHWFDHLKEELHDSFEAVEQEWEAAKEGVWESAAAAKTAAQEWVEQTATEPCPTSEIGAEELSPYVQHPPHKSDKTIYKLLSESKHTTHFAALLDEYEEYKELLDKEDANVTVFVPSDRAFEKIPDHAKKPPKEFVEALLKTHIVPDIYPAGRIFGVHTLPTLLEGEHLSSEPEETPQRLGVKLGWRGLYVNNYNRVTHRDIFASNGVIHGVETFNMPPPPLGVIVSIAPTVFSQFELGMRKTGLAKIARKPHLGATVFAPGNGAWRKLGFGANAFLFSHHGHKYLRALLKYHVVANQTLYSDKFYGPGKDSEEDLATIPKGRFHLDLPTLLDGKTVGIDVGRYGRFINVHVNHFSKVVFQDIIGHDGVIHVIDKVLIPPHDHGKDSASLTEYDGGEIDVEELKARLEPYIECGNHVQGGESLEL